MLNLISVSLFCRITTPQKPYYRYFPSNHIFSISHKQLLISCQYFCSDTTWFWEEAGGAGWGWGGGDVSAVTVSLQMLRLNLQCAPPPCRRCRRVASWCPNSEPLRHHQPPPSNSAGHLISEHHLSPPSERMVSHSVTAGFVHWKDK